MGALTYSTHKIEPGKFLWCVREYNASNGRWETLASGHTINRDRATTKARNLMLQLKRERDQ